MPSLIITLAIDQQHQQFFNGLRAAHFPAHANYLPAHITLFYRLPSEEPAIIATLPAFAQRAPLSVAVIRVCNYGNWVAYKLQCEALQQLHAAMQQAFAPWLTRQDKKILLPHITIQNKVTVYKAQLLHRQLQQQFTPFCLQATGLQTWLYRKGPWKALEEYSFVL